jgi:hypothetical protein
MKPPSCSGCRLDQERPPHANASRQGLVRACLGNFNRFSRVRGDTSLWELEISESKNSITSAWRQE